MGKLRVIGTTIAEIQTAEASLGRVLPKSFVDWLLLNNGRSAGSLQIFPVYDPRDPRKTWDSIVRNFHGAWRQWLDNFSDSAMDFSALLPFAEFGTGDYYCFDYSKTGLLNEPVIVKWRHESGELIYAAGSFSEFLDSKDRPR